MKNSSNAKVGRLLDFISDNQDLTDGEIKNELIADGVNINGFLSRVRQTVRQGKQAMIRAQIAQKESAQIVNHTILNDIASWSRERCLEFIDSMRTNASCRVGQQQVALAFRNKQQNQEMSDDELRSCIKDILSLRDSDEN